LVKARSDGETWQFEIQIKNRARGSGKAQPGKAGADCEGKLKESPAFKGFGTTADEHFGTLMEDSLDKLWRSKRRVGTQCPGRFDFREFSIWAIVVGLGFDIL
jgi:hypothetical protein